MEHKIKIYFILIGTIVFLIRGLAEAGNPAELPVVLSGAVDFKTFWESAKDKGAKERARLFEKIVISKSRPVYRAMVERDKEALRKQVYKKLSSLTQEDADRILANFSRFANVIPQQVSLFKKNFPDAEIQTTFWLGISLRFNGKIEEVEIVHNKKGPVIGFGMEYFQPADDLRVIISHEMTHLYRSEKLGEVTKDVPPMVQKGWAEGIATYASGVLNAQYDYATILFDNGLGETCKKDYHKLAGLYLDEIDNTNDNQRISNWFSGNEQLGQDIPVRAGYCIGLKVVEYLVKYNKLREMLIWPWDKVQREFVVALRYLRRGDHAKNI